MKYICIQSCTAVVDGMGPTRYDRGDVIEAEKRPIKYFEPVGEVPPDFMNDTPEALANKKWNLTMVQDWAREAFGDEIAIPADPTKQDVIDRIVYARENESSAAQKKANQTNT